MRPAAKAFLAALASVVLFSLEAAFARAIGPGIDIGTIGVLRAALQFAFAALVFRVSLVAAFRTERPGMHVTRGLLTVTGGITYFYAFAHLPLAVATVILFTGVMFTTLGAQAFLGEKVGWRRWTATVVGFLGVTLVVRPEAVPLDLAVVMAVLTAVNAAGINIATKGLTRTEDTATIMVWIGAVMVVTSLPILWFTWVWPSWTSFALMLGIALAGTLGQFASITALRNADVSAVAPVFYLRVVVAVVIGWFVFGELVDALTVLGGAIVTGSALYITLREAKLARERGAPPRG